ncbi:MAG: ABC-F family ATP-binding cassette domain-containing protein [Pseudomonadota bacterium]|nr:ABC-F family ATP-binding cassette domain-containing protein [Pseudomonadota bacterium]
MAPPLLLLQDIVLTFGGRPLLEAAGLSVSAGERLCLVGRNGSGKSTLLKIAAGLIEPDSGTRFVQPGINLRYLPQEPDLFGYGTARAYVEAGLGPTGDPHRATAMLNKLGLSGGGDPARLSGGEARRAALARVLAPEPDILLLDEPTNHLDLPAIEWLEAELEAARSALVIVSHDRRFLQNLSRNTVWLDRGRTRFLARGFSEFESWRDLALEDEERADHKLDRKIAAEEHWLRYGVTARRKRNQKRLEGLAAMRAVRRQRGASTGLRLEASEADISGKLVIEAKDVAKSFGERLIVKNFSTRILRGDRLGLIGANGAGKTTLINLLTGTMPPGVGTVRHGANLVLATLDQGRASLDPETVLQDALTGGGSDFVEINGERQHVIGYMKDFLFGPEQARTPIGRLSGGERGRLMLAQALARPSNLLVLDEPTNDLDLETLDLLQEMLGGYKGTLLIVSHDRDFLDRVTTSVLVAEGDGRWIEYAGGYSDMVAQRGAGVSAAPVLTPAANKEKLKPAAVQAQRTAAKPRLTFKERHVLDNLPARIEELRALKARLQSLLDDTGFYARNHAKFAEVSVTFAKAEAALADAEGEWLRLEILREETGGLCSAKKLRAEPTGKIRH